MTAKMTGLDIRDCTCKASLSATSSRIAQEVILKNSAKLLAAAAAAGLLTALGTGTAHADAGLGLHEVSNAQGADVHAGPAGLYLGHLAKGDKFNTTSHDSRGVWCTGHAYGNVHQDGSVLCEDLTPTSW
jgi:hypothetical protein